HSEDAPAGRKRAYQSSEYNRGVVPVGQAVEHAARAIRSAIAGIAAVGGEWDPARTRDRASGLLHQQADLPVACVITERDGMAVRRADAALRAEDQELPAEQLARVPAHAGVLRQAENRAARR